MQLLKYKFRLNPTAPQMDLLNQIAGAQRFVWNHFLAGELARYELDKKFNFYNKNSALLTVGFRLVSFVHNVTWCIN